MDNYKENPNNLIMCVTPLQMLIAEKIIDLNPGQHFDLIVLVHNHNEKYHYYYQKLKEKCVNTLYYIAEPGFSGFLNYINKIKEKSLNRKYKNYYLASIDSRHFQYVISKIYRPNIYTFDDGTANVIKTSIYYQDSKPVLWKRLIWRILGVRFYMEDIKKLSLHHYTLYQNVSNIINNTQKLELFLDEKKPDQQQRKKIKIYLGQPMHELSEKFSLAYIEQYIGRLKPDYYFPHPREKKYPAAGAEIITTFLIFEDYIIQFIKQNPDIEVEVYSFMSTAILNIANISRVSVKYIYEPTLYQLYRNFYDTVGQDFGIELLTLEQCSK